MLLSRFEIWFWRRLSGELEQFRAEIGAMVGGGWGAVERVIWRHERRAVAGSSGGLEQRRN